MIRMLVTFLLRTDPASRKAKPACWKKEIHFSIEIVDKDLHEDDDGSVDNQEELVHVCLHRVKVSTRLALKVQKVRVGEKEFPTSSSADKSDGGAGARVDAAATSPPPSWRRSGSRGVVVGRRGPRVTGAKRSAMFFQRALTRPMFPKFAPRISKR